MKHTVRPPFYNDEENVLASGTPPSDSPSSASNNEQSPGVYTRAEHRSQADLDLLWSGSKLYQKEERSPLFFFIVGFMAAVLLTSGIFWVLNRPLQVKAGEMDYVDKPIDRIEKIDEAFKERQLKAAQEAQAAKTETAKTEKAVSPQPAVASKTETSSTTETPKTEAPKTENKSWFGFPNLFGGGAKAPAQNAGTEATSEAAAAKPAFTTYEVQSGDTLGGIAEKFYKNSGPEYLQKIQRANNMPNPNSLRLGQKLVIPPEN